MFKFISGLSNVGIRTVSCPSWRGLESSPFKGTLSMIKPQQTVYSVFRLSGYRHYSYNAYTHSTSKNQNSNKNWNGRKAFAVGLGLTSVMVGGSLLQAQNERIYNEALVAAVDGANLRVQESPTIVSREEAHRRRKVIYKQMCLGSILGIGTALIMVKISSILIYLTLFGALAFEWLRSRGVIDVKGKQLIKMGTTQSRNLLKRVRIDDVNMFNLSFLVTLALTYANC